MDAPVGERGGVLTESSVDMEEPSEDIWVIDDSGRSRKEENDSWIVVLTDYFYTRKSINFKIINIIIMLSSYLFICIFVTLSHHENFLHWGEHGRSIFNPLPTSSLTHSLLIQLLVFSA